MNHLKKLIVATICIAFTCAGCSDFMHGSYAPLNRSTHPEISDIPIPQGFELDRSESTLHESKNMRFIDYRYEGNASVQNVVDFYNKQMPQYNWGEPQATLFEGHNILTFSKDKEVCTVTISRKGIIPKTHLKIKITPKDLK